MNDTSARTGNMINQPSQKIRPGLRCVAMRAAAFSVAATVLLMGGVLVSANAINTHPARTAAAPSALDNAVTSLQPYVYWPLNTGSFPQADASGNGRPGLSVAGSGGAVTLTGSHPAGGSGGSVRFNPSNQRAGQFLRSASQPIPARTIGTVIVWFKLDRTLPGWWQTLLVDNGATTGYGGGFFINDTGRLVVTDSTGTYYDSPGNFGPRKHTETGPLNDGRWHMLAFVDQYNIDIALNGEARPASAWLPSLLYFDGKLVDKAIVGRLLDDWAGSAKSRLLFGAGQSTQAAHLGRLKGDLAGAALFTRLLSAKEIQSVWDAGS